MNATDANGVTATQTFDRLGRLRTRAISSQGTEDFQYSARGRSAYTGPDGQTTEYGYDDENRLIQAATDTGATPRASRWRTDWVYDGRSRARVRKEYTASTPAALATVSFNAPVLRSDFTGWVGFRFTVGSAPLDITDLGRWVVAGNSASHAVKLVSANGTDVPGGSTTVNTSGKPAGAFAYATLAASITLSANTVYYVVSHEVAGGDQWYNHPGCQITLVSGLATLTGPAWSYDSPTYYYWATVAEGYVPVGLKYSVWSLAGETRYVYDGMRVVQERNAANTPAVAYTRGLDLSSSLEGAGGIGGLLARSHGYSAGNWSTHSYYHADGNGNVTYLMASDQTPAATYKYDPYGRTVSQSGTLANANVYRFSSKELHVNSGFYYYGYRFYDPATQRWANRDLIGEAGGLNLYGFVRNNPVIYFDHFGLDARKPRIGEPGYVTPLPQRPPDWQTDGPWKDDGHATVVCDGKGGIRIQYPKGYDPAKADPWVAECLDKHELCHKQEALASNPNICAGQPDGTQVTAPDDVINRSEVRCS